MSARSGRFNNTRRSCPTSEPTYKRFIGFPSSLLCHPLRCVGSDGLSLSYLQRCWLRSFIPVTVFIYAHGDVLSCRLPATPSSLGITSILLANSSVRYSYEEIFMKLQVGFVLLNFALFLFFRLFVFFVCDF